MGSRKQATGFSRGYKIFLSLPVGAELFTGVRMAAKIFEKFSYFYVFGVVKQ